MKRLIILLSTVAMISFLLLGALQSKRGGYVASKKVTTNNSANLGMESLCSVE